MWRCAVDLVNGGELQLILLVTAADWADCCSFAADSLKTRQG